MLEEIIGALKVGVGETECIRVADLGCSSGPNALAQLDQIIHTTHKLYSKKKPCFQFFLNDLEGNDF
ncbi:UNVERIFIED_CONTAM: hypothetical protein ITH36_25200, partial [Salmonella enterica subsp. enterica serovar Weltevreden]